MLSTDETKAHQLVKNICNEMGCKPILIIPRDQLYSERLLINAHIIEDEVDIGIADILEELGGQVDIIDIIISYPSVAHCVDKKIMSELSCRIQYPRMQQDNVTKKINGLEKRFPHLIIRWPDREE